MGGFTLILYIILYVANSTLPVIYVYVYLQILYSLFEIFTIMIITT